MEVERRRSKEAAKVAEREREREREKEKTERCEEVCVRETNRGT
jgi:hypothetical protein